MLLKREAPRYTAAEFRIVQEGERKKLQGYAAVFNRETVIGSFFREVIRPGAFEQALKDAPDVRALFNHNENYVLGRTTAGTLQLEEDTQGLRYTVDLPDTAVARDLLVSVQRGDVTQSSFAFSVEGEEWDDSETKGGKLPLRVLTRLFLYDVSPVTFPAYEDTTVNVRSYEEVAVSGSNVLAARSLSPFEQRLKIQELRSRL